MPRLKPVWPNDRLELFNLGKKRVWDFCVLNGVEAPSVSNVSKENWYFDVCAYYRPDSGIQICVEKCAYPCGEPESRNWNWPGSVTDREPYGVIAHELGHHCDLLRSERKGRYYGDYSKKLMETSGEKPITSYCPNWAEWFAEMFRLFVTNPELLRAIRRTTYELLCRDWKPINSGSWLDTLGSNVPKRILRTLNNKGAK